MNKSILSVGVAFLAAMPWAYAGSVSDQTARPCFQVSVQNDRVNESNVEQNCKWNLNRTVQAGARNQAQTVQSGSVNNNKVRQYHYEVPPYFNRHRGGQ